MRVAEPSIAVAITVYRPDLAILHRTLAVLRASVPAVFLFIDGPVGEAVTTDELASLQAMPWVRIIQSDRNVGIAAGLNRLAAAAGKNGFSRLAFFDQDSDVGIGLVADLSAAMSRIAVKGRRPAALGPLPTSALDSATKAPTYREIGPRVGSLADVAYLIVSGCCIDLDAWRDVGPFLEDLCMDGVDLEWSFRARKRGYSLWCDTASPMPHRVGTGTVRLGPIIFPLQGEKRMLNYVRSQALMLRLPHVPLWWKIRSSLYVPLQLLAFAIRGHAPRGMVRRAIMSARDGFSAGGGQ